MAQSLLIQAPDKGVNALVPDNMIDNRECSRFTQNINLFKGTIQTPSGFALLAEDGLPLNGGEPILGIAKFQELDRTEHILAVTSSKVYRKNNITDTWDNLVLNDLDSNILRASLYNPVSFITVTHTDAIKADGVNDDITRHILICDGGTSPIQRWGGKYEDKIYSLKGADDYHDEETPAITDHYALQVNLFRDHVILLSPKTWNSAANAFLENPTLIMWGKIGKLEESGTYDITQTGAGATDLLDTGDSNVWCEKLGSQLIVYQKHSIWTLSWVGGNDTFRAKMETDNLGLLAPHLLISYDNKHFFVGNDLNIYVYYGGSTKQLIGTQIRDLLAEDLSYTNAYRCRMSIDANNSRLWIYYVPADGEHVVKAWTMNLKTNAWTPRDFTHVWTDSGITCAVSVGAQFYLTGDSYQKYLDAGTTHDAILTLGTTHSDLIQEVVVDDRLVLGDEDGNIFMCDNDLTTENGENIPARYITKVFDYGLPDVLKWWDGIAILAKGTSFVLSYRIDNFDTENDGWVAFSANTLTDEYKPYSFLLNVTSREIQFKFENVSGSTFDIREFKILSPSIEDVL